MRAALAEVEAEVEGRGLTAVGFVAYEAAPAFDQALRARSDGDFPLLWFGLFRSGERVATLAPATVPAVRWTAEIDRSTYRRQFEAVKSALRQGDSYQVNLSYRLRASGVGDPWNWFRGLVCAQPTPFSAYIHTGRWAVCSASPELFFSRSRRDVVCRPMKGTAPRLAPAAQDSRQASTLMRTAKERAENLMVVDMIRNDLGRIALPGSVTVPSLFNVEAYRSVWQMTSEVRAESSAASCELFQALFPCASITGAPKVHSAGLIADLEISPRKIYTGAIGYLMPQRQARFAVAIRTLLIDTARDTAEYGIGSGVVWDSDDDAEWQECRLKARPVTDRLPSFDLLETLRWTPDEGYFLLDRHLNRLGRTAGSLGYRFDRVLIETRLAEAVAIAAEPVRVRLLLARDGSLSLEATELAANGPDPVRLCWADTPVDSGDPLLTVKTSRREVYDTARSRAGDCDDVILYNERGEVTETTIANLVCEIAGRRLTPAVTSGLLAGTLREELLDRGAIEEAVISREMLAQADKVWCINSVRGWRRAVLLGAEDKVRPGPDARDLRHTGGVASNIA